VRLRNLLAALLTIALVAFSAPVSNATPLNFIIQFDDASIPGLVNWTGSYTVDSNTGLLTAFEATICRPAAPLDCQFNNLFSVSLPAVDDPDDNDNVETDVLTSTNSAVLALRDGVTNEWQIFDPFGSLTHGVYATRRVPEVESVFLCVSGLALLFVIRRRNPAADGKLRRLRAEPDRLVAIRKPGGKRSCDQETRCG
jgi:hypothetical protein